DRCAHAHVADMQIQRRDKQCRGVANDAERRTESARTMSRTPGASSTNLPSAHLTGGRRQIATGGVEMLNEHKHWLITGVSSGIGRATAEAALAAGYRVVGTVRRREQLSEFEALCPGRASAVLMDVTQPSSVSSGVAAAAKATNGRFEVLVNNAGWGLIGAI